MRLALRIVITSVVLSSSLFASTDLASGEKKGKDPVKSNNTYVDVKLPVSTPFTSQWIVVVNGPEMKIVPAITKKEDDGTVVSAAVPDLGPGTLRAAIAIDAEGKTISTPLRTGR